jgi:hypothetical protein
MASQLDLPVTRPWKDFWPETTSSNPIVIVSDCS